MGWAEVVPGAAKSSQGLGLEGVGGGEHGAEFAPCGLFLKGNSQRPFWLSQGRAGAWRKLLAQTPLGNTWELARAPASLLWNHLWGEVSVSGTQACCLLGTLGLKDSPGRGLLASSLGSQGFPQEGSVGHPRWFLRAWAWSGAGESRAAQQR